MQLNQVLTVTHPFIESQVNARERHTLDRDKARFIRANSSFKATASKLSCKRESKLNISDTVIANSLAR